MLKLSFAPENLHWFFALMTPIAVSLLGVVIAQSKSNAAHRSVKTLNDCLAKHQLVYFSFYFALLKGANLMIADQSLAELVMFLAILSLLAFSISVWILGNQDERIRALHQCTRYCTGSLQPRLWFKAYSVILFLAIGLLGTALFVAFSSSLSSPSAKS